jgi:predicted amidohydrolase
VLELADGRVYNTSVLLDRGGEPVARYRKIHLFDADPPGGLPSRESSLYAAGDQIVTAETEFGRAGMSICYDVRFPELYRALAANGATVLFVPSAFRYETGKDHWDVLLRARAIEDQCFVFAAARVGTWGRGHERRTYGNSLALDPWGRVLARAPDGVGVTVAECDLSESVASARRCPRSATDGSASSAEPASDLLPVRAVARRISRSVQRPMRPRGRGADTCIEGWSRGGRLA